MEKIKDTYEVKRNGSLSKDFSDRIINSTKLSEKTEIEQKLNTYIKQKNVHMVPPDGGWGWMIILGGFITMVLCSVPMFGFGILFSPLLMTFNVSSAKIAWIFNVHGLIWNTFALLVGPLCKEFGWRKLSVVGGILNFLSVVLSGFVPRPEFLFFTFSVLGGIGGSIGLTCTFIVVSRYFEKRRGFALGIASLGMCASSFISPLTANYLLQNYGYTGASMIFGALVLNQCVGGALYQPVEWHMIPAEADPETENKLNEEIQGLCDAEDNRQSKRVLKSIHCRKLSALSSYSSGSLGQSLIDIRILSRNKPVTETPDEGKSVESNRNFYFILIRILKSTYGNLTTLKYMRVIIIAIGAGCLMMGYVNFQMWIPFAVINAGYSLEMAAWCVSAASITNVIGRLLMTSLSDRKRFSVKYGYMFGNLFIGICIIAFSIVKDIKLLLIFVCCWGLNVGAALSLHATVMIEIMGVDLFPAVIGVASVSIGLFSIVIGPTVGMIRDATSSYKYALWLLGAMGILSFMLWTLMPLAEKYDQKLDAKKDKLKDKSEYI